MAFKGRYDANGNLVGGGGKAGGWMSSALPSAFKRQPSLRDKYPPLKKQTQTSAKSVSKQNTNGGGGGGGSFGRVLAVLSCTSARNDDTLDKEKKMGKGSKRGEGGGVGVEEVEDNAPVIDIDSIDPFKFDEENDGEKPSEEEGGILGGIFSVFGLGSPAPSPRLTRESLEAAATAAATASAEKEKEKEKERESGKGMSGHEGHDAMPDIKDFSDTEFGYTNCNATSCDTRNIVGYSFWGLSLTSITTSPKSRQGEEGLDFRNSNSNSNSVTHTHATSTSQADEPAPEFKRPPKPKSKSKAKPQQLKQRK